MSNKDRDIPISEFFEILQKEYICAEIRERIFSQTHSNYWKSVMEGKKEKIQNISKRNRFLSIFDNEKEYLRIFSKVVPEWGLPEFLYVSDNQRQKISKWDKLLFFSKGCEVKVLQEDGTYLVGEVLDNYNVLDNNPRLVVKIKKTSNKLHLPINRVSRIF